MISKERPTIGFQIQNIQNSYSEALWSSAVKIAKEKNINLIIFCGEALNSGYPYNYQLNSVYEFINAHTVDAVVIAAGTLYNRLDESLYYHKRFGTLPTVLLGMKIDNIPSVLIENYKGMQQAVKHLIEKHSFSRIAFIKGTENHQEAEERFQAYLDTLTQYNIPIDPDLIVNGDFTPESGLKALKILLDKRKVKFNALIASNDIMAIAVIKGLQMRGIKVPQDIAVIGFDNIEQAPYLDPALSTVSQPLFDQTRTGIEMALKLIDGYAVEESIRLETRLIVRSSCGCFSNSLNYFETLNTRYKTYKLSSLKKRVLENVKKLLETTNLNRDNCNSIRLFAEDFMTDIENGKNFEKSDELYLKKLNSIINQMLQNYNEPFIWNDILSILYNFVITFSGTLDLNQINLFFQKARILVADLMRQQEAINKIQSNRMVLDLLDLTHNLVSIRSINDLIEVINNELPKLMIKSGFICLYQTEFKQKITDRNWNLPADSYLMMAFNENGKIKLKTMQPAHKTKDLIPKKMLPHHRSYAYIIIPIFYQEDQLGYMLLEMGHHKGIIYEALRKQISSAIKSALIFQIQERAENGLKSLNDMLIESNEKLKELDRAKTNFFANISHELRTPLTLILGPTEAIISGEYGDKLDCNDAIFKSLLNNQMRLLKLINNLLDFAKLEAGKMPINKKKTHIGKLLEYYVETVKQAAISRGLEISFINQTEEVISWIDRDLFEIAIMNILSNALKFTPEGGEIVVQLNQDDNDFTIQIKDTGIGIPENEFNRIFERFTQVDSSSSRKYPGTGIGLVFTKEVIELHDGSIKVDSKLGIGSVFIIKLPILIGENNSLNDEIEDIHEIRQYLLADMFNQIDNSKKLNLKAETNKNTVLIVDDNKDMHYFLISILKKDYNVILASNGKEALKKAMEESPDIIISDVMMPEMDGCELIKQIKNKSELKSIPIILLTAKADLEMRIAGLEVGADDYIAKPFNSRELKARIKSNLEMKHLRDDLALKKLSLEHIISEQTRTIEEEKNHAIRLQKKAEKQLEDFLLVMASAIESKDQYTGGHVARVANYSKELARKLNLSENEIKDIYLGGIVHDVGKIGIKDSILNKSLKLNDHEIQNMKEHPVIGKKMLSKIDDIDTIIAIVFCHQERWDGSGYPQGLKGYEIPLAARIVTIADYWDSIVTDRPYRKALSLEKAKSEMLKEREKGFDPYLFDLFMNEQDQIYLKYLSNNNAT